MGRLGKKLIQEIVLHSNYEFVILDIGGGSGWDFSSSGYVPENLYASAV